MARSAMPNLRSIHSTQRTSDLGVLERRLADGYARIEIAIANGEDVTAWEDFWVDLLHRYEAECDALPQAA